MSIDKMQKLEDYLRTKKVMKWSGTKSKGSEVEQFYIYYGRRLDIKPRTLKIMLEELVKKGLATKREIEGYAIDGFMRIEYRWNPFPPPIPKGHGKIGTRGYPRHNQ